MDTHIIIYMNIQNNSISLFGKLMGVACSAFIFASCSEAPKIMDGNVIRVNQVGYYPNEEKTATIEEIGFAKEYKLVDNNGKTVWKGAAARKAISEISGKSREVVDFSEVKTPGEYTLVAGDYAQPVVIADKALNELAKGAMKAFYYQRTAMPIEEQYAGKWNRPAAHPDTNVMVHQSAASKTRPAGTIISCPGGWYDAGDFNKYIVNSSFSHGIMFCAYQMSPEQYNSYGLNIPESGNATPDFLDENLYNLQWMLTMQDPADGGLYHKLTTPNFEGFIMPAEAQQQRYVVQKSTAATLDFAATMCQAARIYGAYPEYADFVAKCIPAAEKAYQWAVKNPKVLYFQNDFNKTCEPKITTGIYGDGKVDDEFFWAATELYLSTGKDSYLADAKKYAPSTFTLPVWGELATLGVYDWINASLKGDEVAKEMAEQFVPGLIAYCDNKLATIPTSCFQSSYGNFTNDFGWGFLAEVCCTTSISMLYANALTGNRDYVKAALENADYLLGQNATGYSYVTGFGTKPFMNPHMRISFADGIEDPIPGFLSGGPNPGKQDEASCPYYTTDFADECYLDNMSSYATNEVAINWNACLVAMIGWLDAIL